jgi:membrane-bound metal-dependent hydrolase YbcI (DUF457 family)
VHAAIGASAPAALVITGHVDPLQGAVMSAISAGFSLLPDLDHPKATATKALGMPAHLLAHALCKAAVGATATGRDRGHIAWQQVQKRDPYHRTLTHTLAAAVLVGTLGFLSVLAGAVFTGMVASFGVFLLWPLRKRAIGPVVLAAAAAAVGAVFLLDPWLMALAVGGGYVSHLAADACTAAGVPALWPLAVRTTGANGVVRKKRWWNVRLLGGLVASGSREEKGPAIGVALAVNGVLLLLEL